MGMQLTDSPMNETHLRYRRGALMVGNIPDPLTESGWNPLVVGQ